MKRISVFVFVLAWLCRRCFAADEGMWTFDNPPRSTWKERYNFGTIGCWGSR